MNRAFEGFWSRGERPFGGLAAVFGEGAPRSDVVETDAGIEVTVELPGLEEKDIEVSLSDEALTIKGEKKVERKDEKRATTSPSAPMARSTARSRYPRASTATRPRPRSRTAC